MKTLKKVTCAGLLLILSNVICFSQDSVESDSLSFKRSSWSNRYCIGNKKVSYDDFIKNLSDRNEQSAKMFKTGRSVSITGIAIASVGAGCAGYDLGGRLAGAEGNTALLVGGGIDGKQAVLTTGIYCQAEEWNAKKGEIRMGRDNNSLTKFRERIEQKEKGKNKCGSIHTLASDSAANTFAL